MRPRRRHANILLLATFQVAVTVVVPVADALLEAASAALPTHVESESASACSGHDHAFCQLCRTLNLPAATSEVARQGCPPPATTLVAGAQVRHSFAPPSHLSGSLGPRAPPTA